MFDAKRLLGQLIASKMGGGQSHSGHGYGRGSSPLDSFARQIGGGGGSGALAGGLASILLGSKKRRGFGGSAGKLGGLAFVGSLAYRAYQDWQASQAPRGGNSAGNSFIPQHGQSPWGQAGGATPAFAPPPSGTPFHPEAESD